MTKVVVGVSGSIAAWKACDLVSKLVQSGRTVDVVMTRAARRFVRPLAFSALTHRAVFTDRTWTQAGMPHAHLKMTEDADLLVVAPLTANSLAKFAHGIADDVLSTTWLAAACPTLVAPAMNPRMWEHPRTRANRRVLEEDGVRVVGPAPGWLSEGEVGIGRMSEPAEILAAADALLRSSE
jgi:phosphopantothenoylcysteine decarboxylase/phosphopantothenate--cysteine ligase